MEKYSSMKLELLALKWALSEKFREYLLGSKCTVYTDNNPFSHFQSIKLGATEQRWVAQLAGFDFTVQYRPGRVNGNADSLSRQYSGQVNEDRGDGFDLHNECPLDVTQNAGADVMLQQIGVFPSHCRADLMALQGADPLLKSFLLFWRLGQLPTKEQRVQLSRDLQCLLRQGDRITEKNGLLYRRAMTSHGEEFFSVAFAFLPPSGSSA